jgi:thiosulfate/3-mercaptopyruvate sulfurtransferase
MKHNLSTTMQPIIHPTALAAQRQNIILIDARPGIQAYQQAHLEGALHVDLDSELSDIKADAAEGGRHPLPSAERFADLLSSLGILRESHVVVYDAMGGANSASRFWWMLRAMGHQKVQVLDGGYQAAVEAGIATSTVIEKAILAPPYPVAVGTREQWQLPQVDMERVDKIRSNPDFLIIDVRAKERYEGITEPIDLIAGHIPGAVNLPLSENLDEKGFFRLPELLKAQYLQLLAGRKPENVVVHCGSGVTACHTLLAFAQAGLEIPKLYVGSWSEWSRNEMEMVTI